MTLKESWKKADLCDKGFIILVALLAMMALIIFACFIIWAIASIRAGTV